MRNYAVLDLVKDETREALQRAERIHHIIKWTVAGMWFLAGAISILLIQYFL